MSENVEEMLKELQVQITKELKQAYYDWDVHYAVLMKGTQFEELHGKDVLGKKAVRILFENEAGYILELGYK